MKRTNSDDPISTLVDLLSRLPGIGEKSAQRMTFHILRQDRAYAAALADALTRLGRDVQACSECHNLTHQNPCALCRDQRRDPAVLCVVATPQDLMAVEACGEYRGHYHVLGGLLSPLEGVGPEGLNIQPLITRLSRMEVKEVILALRPSVEGESTSFYLKRLLSPLVAKVTRIASGIPMGGELEYADKVTLARALTGRHLA
ncbi:MAG: recombination mediator RecR [Myxococcota bacterium]